MKLKYLIIAGYFMVYIVLFAQETTPEPTSDAPINLSISEVNAYLKTDVTETILGKPISATLIAEMPIGYNVVNWPTNTIVEPFQVIDRDEVRIREQGNLVIQEQPFELVAWDLERITTGEVFLTYQRPDGQQFRTPVTSITVNVTATRPENDVMLRPSEPQIDLPYIPPYLYLIPFFIIATIIAIVRRLRFNQRFQRALATPDSPVQQAIIELKHLLDTNISVEDLFPLVADEIRTYITSQFHIPATDMTTFELVQTLQANPIFSSRLCDSLAQFLEQADLVKFANQRPLVTPESVTNFAIQWIEHAERSRIAHG